MGTLVVAATLYALGLILAVGLRIASGSVEEMAGLGSFPVSQVAGLLALIFARAPVSFNGMLLLRERVFGDATFALPVLGIFILMAVLLVWAGRRTAKAISPATTSEAAMAGAKVGLPYGILMGAAAWFFKLETAQGVIVEADLNDTFVLTLLSGVLFGAWGGLRTRGGLRALSRGQTRSSRLWGGATVASLWGMGVGVLVSGLLMTAAAVFATMQLDGFSFLAEQSGWALAGAIAAFLLVLPNLATDLFILAHGGTFVLPSVLLGMSGDTTPLNYLSWPLADPGSSIAPGWSFVLMLVPLLSVILAGYWAAGQARVSSREEASAAGLRVGIPYAVAVFMIGALSRLAASGSISVGGDRFGGDLALGVSLAAALFVPLMWGLAGGWLGSLLASPRVISRPQTAPHGPATPASTTTIECSACGTTLDAKKRFCTNCGTEIEHQHSAVTLTGEVAPETTPNPDEGGASAGVVAPDYARDVQDNEESESLTDAPVGDSGKPAPGPEGSTAGHGEEADERQCGHCGAANPGDYRFCSSCGQSLEGPK